MCGIAGIVGRSDPGLIQRMTDLLAHRGPDGEGFHHGAGVSLGHRRLVVIDREGGVQPMHDASGRYSLVYNGEIYNYRALRELLRRESWEFRTHSDTEVVLSALIHWGEAALERFQGMFALALWDGEEGRLLLARDPVGVKPLYFAEINGTLYFASEMKSLLVCPGVSRAIDLEALEDYLTFLYTAPPRTIYRDIRQLPAGHCATWRAGVRAERRYWKWSMDPQAGDAAAWQERLTAYLDESMRYYAEADVPVGALLSGGLDSACIVAQLSRATPPETFSIGFDKDGQRLDETASAQLTAAHLGTRHREIRAEAKVAELLPAMVRCFDEPFGNPTALLFHVLSREVRRHVTVVLSGDGGDEVFGGYRRYQAIALSEQLRWVPVVCWRTLGRGIDALPVSGRPTMARLGRHFRAQGMDVVDRYAAWTTYHDRSSLDELYAPELRRALQDRDPLIHLRLLEQESRTLGPINQAMYFDLSSFLPNNVLRYGDRMSMAHGLEMRVPLADPILANTFLGMPTTFKVSGGTSKVLLRRHLSGKVPAGVITRAKQGLNPPMGPWLKGALKPMLEEYLSEKCVAHRGFFAPGAVSRMRVEHLAGQRDHTWRLWALMVFEEWHRAYLD